VTLLKTARYYTGDSGNIWLARPGRRAARATAAARTAAAATATTTAAATTTTTTSAPDRLLLYHITQLLCMQACEGVSKPRGVSKTTRDLLMFSFLRDLGKLRKHRVVVANYNTDVDQDLCGGGWGAAT
jgi:hypothetical protein